MAWFHALMPAVEAFAIHVRITAIARTLAAGNPDEDRTLDQRRGHRRRSADRRVHRCGARV